MVLVLGSFCSVGIVMSFDVNWNWVCIMDKCKDVLDWVDFFIDFFEVPIPSRVR